MIIKPIGKRLLVKLSDIESTTKAGLILTTSAKQEQQTAEVIAVSPDVETDIKVGQKILIGKYVGTEFELGGEKQIIINENDILAVLE